MSYTTEPSTINKGQELPGQRQKWCCSFPPFLLAGALIPQRCKFREAKEKHTRAVAEEPLSRGPGSQSPFHSTEVGYNPLASWDLISTQPIETQSHLTDFRYSKVHFCSSPQDELCFFFVSQDSSFHTKKQSSYKEGK